MVHKILQHSLTACLLATVSSGMLLAENDTSRRLKMLEQKVATMQVQIHELTVINKQIRSQITQLSPAEKFDNLACNDRALALQEKLDQLQKLGFKNSHPDVHNVTRQLENLDTECLNNDQSDETSDTLVNLGCEARITKLRQEKDTQLALGFQPTHPDILSMNKLIDKISSECSPS